MNKRLYDVINGKEENYMLPFYWQHGDHHEKIPEQVERIYESGCRALCVESRPHKDFCGKTWWDDMDLIISECEKRNMKVWILDDDHFPTGHANGKLKEHPELRKWQLAERHVDVTGPLTDALLIANCGDEDNVLLGAYAYRRTGKGEGCEPDPVGMNGTVKDGFLKFSLPKGCFRIFFIYKTRAGTNRPDYIDMLREESVKLLIDEVYEPHYEHYGRYFGGTVEGFFSDEPFFGNDWYGPHSVDRGMYDHSVGMPGLALPYNDRVIDMMKEKIGRDPLPLLPALWFDMGDMTGEVRHAFMDAVTTLYRNCFTRQLGDWCREHGVKYIGHIIEDMNAHGRLGCSAGHYFRSLDGQSMSGIDIVLHQIIPGLSDHIHTSSTFGNNADPAFFDYVLPKLGSSLAHIGTQMQGRAMCEVFGAYGWAEGAPMMKWLLDFLLVRGVNHFVPHAFSPAFPDPDCPPHFGADGKDPQFEGFGKLMRYGNKAAHLLSGTHKADAAILYHADAEWYNGEEDSMLTQVPAKMLYDEHIDFDILPCDCFTDKECRMYKAKAENGRLRVGEETYSYLIIPAYKRLPEYIEKAISGIESKGVNVIRMDFGTEKEELTGRINERDIRIDGGYPHLRCAHFINGTDHVYMFVNESVNEAVKTKARLNSIKGDRECAVLDLLNDEIYKAKTEDGCLTLELAPYQSVIVSFDHGEGYAQLKDKKGFTPVCEAELSFNIFTASYGRLSEFEPFKENVTDLSELDLPSGFSGRIRYECEFDLQKDVTGVDLGEVGQTSHLWCNGKDCGIRVCPPYRYDLSNSLVKGKNKMIIEVSNTLANAVRDAFSSFIPIPRSGLFGRIVWLKN